MNIITFDDKVALNEHSDIPDINKITASDMNEIKNAINNLIYPVGTYYETSDTSFDPNVTWGGTWQLDSAGRVTVARDTTDSDFDTIGETGGEKTHTLTVEEIPKHSHGVNDGSGPYGYNISGLPIGTTSGSGVGYSGGGQAHNNLQPYIVVNRWHRTA